MACINYLIFIANMSLSSPDNKLSFGKNKNRVRTLAVGQTGKLNNNAVRTPSAARLKKERKILNEAEKQFAQFGFEGASLENIAQAIGMSRHNLLYYFPSKEILYRSVLDEVLTQWLDGLSELANDSEPTEALRQYIHKKLQSARKQPNSTKMFTKEMIAGAPHYGDVISERVAPILNNKVAMFQQWAKQGKIKDINFTHLMFIIWSATQAYADQQAQFSLLLNKPHLEAQDYEDGEKLIVDMVLACLKMP